MCLGWNLLIKQETKSRYPGDINMEITEDHLQKAFDELQEYAIKGGKKGIEYEAIVSTAWTMRTKLLNILKAKSEKDLLLSKIISEDIIGMLQTYHGDLSSPVYKCGHDVKPWIIKDVAGSLETYTEWKNDAEGLCIECWIKQKKGK